MRGRAFRITFLLFEALWLNVIVPGHQRGIVSLPGTACPNCAPSEPVEPCCADEKPAPKECPIPGDPAKQCAICHFAAMLTIPPPIDLSAPSLGLLEFLPVPAAGISRHASFRVTRYERGPPLV